MIITDLSHLNDLHERKVAIKGGHSYSKSYSFADSHIGSSYSSSMFDKYREYFDMYKSKYADMSKYFDASAYSKYADSHGMCTVAEASTYEHGDTSYSYSVAMDSAH